MRLSGLAGFLLYDALQRAGMTDGRTFRLRTYDGSKNAYSFTLGEDSNIVLTAGQPVAEGCCFDLQPVADGDKIASFRGQPILAISEELDQKLASTRLDARMEGHTVTLTLSTDIASFTLPGSEESE